MLQFSSLSTLEEPEKVPFTAAVRLALEEEARMM